MRRAIQTESGGGAARREAAMDPAGASVANDIGGGGGGEGEKFAVGNIYSVKVITGDEFRGIVMAYDPIPNFVFFDILGCYS